MLGHKSYKRFGLWLEFLRPRLCGTSQCIGGIGQKLLSVDGQSPYVLNDCETNQNTRSDNIFPVGIGTAHFSSWRSSPS
ncbi:unnamed protein product [Peronospora belbahrii]|uniref:Uncharacterized protein n=1 Tax=Peronospora belbahrii TaxID=622444 RepID=A0AAU9L8X5_9STRA|nr:unnamed protein product [Peronospora belbahrii]